MSRNLIASETAVKKAQDDNHTDDHRALARSISKKIDKAIFRYDLIEHGDRVLVGVSGGKDSLSLLHQLSRKQPRFSRRFELAAAHVESELSNPEAVDRLEELCAEWGIPFHRLKVNLADRVLPGKRLSCYWCSTQRRTELIQFAEEHDFTKIALGHHMDDILETFFMNLTHKGELSTMLPKMSYDKYRQSVIRPLAWVTEEELIRYTDGMDEELVICQCGFDTTSKRREVRPIIDFMINAEGEKVRERMMEAMHNPRLRYLILEENNISNPRGVAPSGGDRRYVPKGAADRESIEGTPD
jgi:tRNA 2-thiocytidine biosynthesis protein TtcA